MPNYTVTGKLGSGKSLIAVAKAFEYLRDGRRVATNLDLMMDAWPNPWRRDLELFRLPDKPTLEDLEALPPGYDPSGGVDESRAGMLLLDECASWFNTRDRHDRDRAGLLNWMVHARKKGWDVWLIVQDVSMIDSQYRSGMCEHTVFCRRLDRIPVPIVGTLLGLLAGWTPRLPRVHAARCVYGTSWRDLLVDRWVYRGKQFYGLYDTRQVFAPREYSPHWGTSCVLTPWHLTGRFKPRPPPWYVQLAMRFRRVLSLAIVWPGLTVQALATGRPREYWARRWGLHRNMSRDISARPSSKA